MSGWESSGGKDAASTVRNGDEVREHDGVSGLLACSAGDELPDADDAAFELFGIRDSRIIHPNEVA